jgi:hypothetical protein
MTLLLWTFCKSEVHPATGHEGQKWKHRHASTLSLTSALDVGGWSTPRRGRFNPDNDQMPTVQEAGWATGPVWTGTENLASQPGFDPRTVQSVECRPTDICTGRKHVNKISDRISGVPFPFCTSQFRCFTSFCAIGSVLITRAFYHAIYSAVTQYGFTLF